MKEKKPRVEEVRCEGSNCTVDLKEAIKLDIEARMERLKKNG